MNTKNATGYFFIVCSMSFAASRMDREHVARKELDQMNRSNRNVAYH